MEIETSSFQVGDKVIVTQLPPYLKTAESMPMLRPSSAIAIGEEGIILKATGGGYWGIRFSQGAFLLESRYFQGVKEINRQG